MSARAISKSEVIRWVDTNIDINDKYFAKLSDDKKPAECAAPCKDCGKEPCVCSDNKKPSECAASCKDCGKTPCTCSDKKPATCSDVTSAECKKNVMIDMLRTGKFIRKNMWGDYKVIDINEAMMDLMIKNFSDNVVSHDIALDVNHEGKAAYGWLKSLKKENRNVNGKLKTFLLGDWELTQPGIDAVKNKIYSLFSIEFHPNFQQREVDATIKDDFGDEIPLGNVTNFGPTILGGALTNRPFIPNLNAVAFTENDNRTNDNRSYLFEVEDETPVRNLKDTPNTKNSGANDAAVVTFDETTTNDNLTSKNNFFNGFKFNKHKDDPIVLTRSGEEKMKLEATNAMISFTEKKLSEMDKSTQEYTDLNKVLDGMKAERDAATKLSAENDSFKTQIADNATKVVALERQVTEHAQELAITRERSRTAEVSAFISSLATKGFTRPTQKAIEELLNADRDGAMCLTVGTNKMNMRDIAMHILNSLPSDAKVSMTEQARTEAVEVKDSDKSFFETNKEALDSGKKKAFSAYNRKMKKSSATSDSAE